MGVRLGVSEAMAEEVRPFVTQEQLDVEIVDPEEECDCRIISGNRSQESSLGMLVQGGTIRCATAWGMAKKMGIPLMKFGALLDLLDIKVRACSLGCFS